MEPALRLGRHYAARAFEWDLDQHRGAVAGGAGDLQSAAERFYAVGFTLEQMRQNLGDLDRCIAEWSVTPPVVNRDTRPEN